jgi:hypothetical protein
MVAETSQWSREIAMNAVVSQFRTQHLAFAVLPSTPFTLLLSQQSTSQAKSPFLQRWSVSCLDLLFCIRSAMGVQSWIVAIFVLPLFWCARSAALRRMVYRSPMTSREAAPSNGGEHQDHHMILRAR